jgi:hypothetical protein
MLLSPSQELVVEALDGQRFTLEGRKIQKDADKIASDGVCFLYFLESLWLVIYLFQFDRFDRAASIARRVGFFTAIATGNFRGRDASPDQGTILCCSHVRGNDRLLG